MKKQRRLIALLCGVMMLTFSCVTSFASTADNSNSNAQFNESLYQIEKALADQGISIEEELNRQIQLYDNEMKSVTDEESKEKLQFLIDATASLLSEYKAAVNSKGQAVQADAGYAAAVSSIVTWFGYQGYYLSSELLMYARDNTKLDATYEHPYWIYRVQDTSTFKSLKSSTKLSGTGAFPNSGSTVEKDMYYAIHAFSWSKPSQTGQVTINDRYDFALNDRYDGLAGTAANIMYYAQQAGYLTPFKIKATY